MERYIQINWDKIVKEAIKRRKAQGLSQKRLAAIAGISAPTVSRFENCKADIQLSSVLSILNMLGMLERQQDE